MIGKKTARPRASRGRGQRKGFPLASAGGGGANTPPPFIIFFPTLRRRRGGTNLAPRTPGQIRGARVLHGPQSRVVRGRVPVGRKSLTFLQPLRRGAGVLFENGIEPLTLRFSVLCSTPELFKPHRRVQPPPSASRAQPAQAKAAGLRGWGWRSLHI